MNAYSLNRAAAVALAVSAAGCGAGANLMNDSAQAQLLAASEPLPAKREIGGTGRTGRTGEAGGPNDSAPTEKAPAVEQQSGMVAQRHFDLYQRFHGLTPEGGAAQAHAADKQDQMSDGRTAAACPPTPSTAGATMPVSSGE